MQLKDQDNAIYDLYEGESPVKFSEMYPRPLRCIFRASIQFTGSRIRRADYEVENYVTLCRGLGIKYGLYHFLTPNGIAEQAALFLSVWNKCGGADMAPIVDVEVDLQKSYSGTIGNAVWQSHIKTFLDYIAQGTGRTPIIYTNENYWNNFVLTRSGLIWSAPAWTKDYPLWVAKYMDNPDAYAAPPKLPSGWTQWAMWQYSDAGRSNGFLANDLNIASEWYKAELGTVEEPPVEPPTDEDYYIITKPDGESKKYVPAQN